MTLKSEWNRLLFVSIKDYEEDLFAMPWLLGATDATISLTQGMQVDRRD